MELKPVTKLNHKVNGLPTGGGGKREFHVMSGCHTRGGGILYILSQLFT